MKWLVLPLMMCCCDVQAQTPAAVIGHGSTSCGQWLNARNQAKGQSVSYENMGAHANRIGMAQWTQGFLSGINSTRIERNRQAYTLPDYDSIEAYMDKSCAENPLQNLYQVVLKLQLAIRTQEQLQGRGKD